MAKSNRFSPLRERLDKYQEAEIQEDVESAESESIVGEGTVTPPSESSPPIEEKLEKPKAVAESAPAKPKKRGPGRPRGRRSDPGYTQISAYLPLELLLEVQDELAEERREQLKRTPRPVSDLVEELLADWLKKRKRKKSAG